MTVTMETLKVGDLFPEVTLPLLKGGELNFKDLRGKKILLYFWGSW